MNSLKNLEYVKQLTKNSIPFSFFYLLSLSVIVLSFCAPSSAIAQRKLLIDGTLTVGSQKLNNATVTIFKDGQKVDAVTTKSNGKFEVELELEHLFMLVFGKEGLVSKKIEVDTRGIPEEEKETANLYYGKWKVELFEESLGLNTSILKQPIGKVSYNPTYMQFANDDKYTKSIRKQLDELLAELEAAREQMLLLEEQLEEDYYLAIQDGDAFYKEKDYENALFQYQAALRLKPDEPYPTNMLEKVQAELGASEVLEEQYAALLTSGDDSFNAEQYEEAIGFYQDALNLKPNEEYPQEQIKIAEKALAEAEQNAKKQQEYDKLIADADIALNGQAYEDAKERYEKATRIFPEEEYPKTKIKEIETLLANQLESEKAYNLALKQGEAALKAERYEEAKGYFEEAGRINPAATRPPAALKEIETAMAALLALEADKAALEKAAKEKLEKDYARFLAEGDRAFEANELSLSIESYESALELKPEEAYPKEQINLAKQKLGELATLEENYAAQIKDAEQKFRNKEYDAARSSYEKALALKPEEQTPKDAIAEIDGILSAQAAALAAKEAEEAARLAALEEEYQSLIAQGDAAFETADYTTASKAYEGAREVKPEEAYPIEQLQKINNLLANAEERDNNYKTAIAEADKLLAKELWEDAKAKYAIASSIKSEEEYPSRKIAEIDAKLVALKAAEEEANRLEAERLAKLDADYNALLESAKTAEAGEQYDLAISKLKEAKELKPQEAFPASEIIRITGLIEGLAAAEEARLKAERDAKALEDKYRMIVDNADMLLKEERYNEAKSKYQEASGLKPEEAYPKDQITLIEAKLSEIAAAKEAERLAEEEAKRVEVAFNGAITEASVAMSGGNLELARTKLDEAKAFKPTDPVLNKKYDELKNLEDEAQRLADQQKLEEERAKAKLAEYDSYMTEGAAALTAENYDAAKSSYEKARDLFPDNEEPKVKLKEIAEIQEELRKAAALAETDTEFNYELAKKYPQGRTENTEEKGNKTITQIVIVTGNRGDEYIKERYSWGQEFYLKNGKPYNKNNWLNETRK